MQFQRSFKEATADAARNTMGVRSFQKEEWCQQIHGDLLDSLIQEQDSSKGAILQQEYVDKQES